MIDEDKDEDFGWGWAADALSESENPFLGWGSDTMGGLMDSRAGSSAPMRTSMDAGIGPAVRASVDTEPLAAARAAEDKRFASSSSSAAAAPVHIEPQDDKELMKPFPKPTQNEWEKWNLRNPYRGKRTDVKPATLTSGLEYEIALHAWSRSEKIAPDQLPVIRRRIDELRKDPKKALWENELGLLSTVDGVSTRSGPYVAPPPPKAPIAAPEPRIAKELQPTGTGRDTGEILFHGGHWWYWTKPTKKWLSLDHPPSYGSNPVGAMQAYLVALTKTFIDSYPTDFKIGKKYDLKDPQRPDWPGIKIVAVAKQLPDGEVEYQLQPSHREIRRVFDMDDLNSSEYTKTQIAEIEKRLEEMNYESTHPEDIEGRRGNFPLAKDAVLGHRAEMQRGGYRVPVIWSGVRWLPLEPQLRRALGYGKLGELWRRKRS